VPATQRINGHCPLGANGFVLTWKHMASSLNLELLLVIASCD